MAGLRSFSFVMLVIELLVFVCGSIDQTVDILKDKMIAMESSLDQDIKLLRMDMRKLSDELSHITGLLKDALGDRRDVQPENVKEAPEKNENDLEEFKNRMKRSFAMEKAHSRVFIKEIKSEIGTFGTEMSRVLTKLGETQTRSQMELSEFKADTLEAFVVFKADTLGAFVEFKSDTLEKLADFKAETLETLVEFKAETFKEIKEGQTRVQLGLTEYLNETLIHEIDAMSNDITIVTNECVSGLETLSTTNEKQASTIDSSMKALSLKITGLDVKANNIESKVKYIFGKPFPITNNKYTVGTTRLANVIQEFSTIGGRLEVYYDGKWGTVCDDGFDMPETKVACRALGLRGHSYRSSAYFGQGSEPTWMDNLKCAGQESSLFNCPRYDNPKLGEHNCDHNEDVGVICLK